MGRDSSVGIATGYGLDGPGIEFRLGGRFSARVQTGPGAHPASCTMDTGSSPGVKYGRGVMMTTNPLLVPWSWKSRAISLPTLWATTGPVTGALYLYLLQIMQVLIMMSSPLPCYLIPIKLNKLQLYLSEILISSLMETLPSCD